MSEETEAPQESQQRSDAFRVVAEWAWTNSIVPSEIHDAAAFALDRPSLAHGFYKPSKTTNGGSKLDGDACEE